MRTAVYVILILIFLFSVPYSYAVISSEGYDVNITDVYLDTGNNFPSSQIILNVDLKNMGDLELHNGILKVVMPGTDGKPITVLREYSLKPYQEYSVDVKLDLINNNTDILISAHPPKTSNNPNHLFDNFTFAFSPSDLSILLPKQSTSNSDSIEIFPKSDLNITNEQVLQIDYAFDSPICNIMVLEFQSEKRYIHPQKDLVAIEGNNIGPVSDLKIRCLDSLFSIFMPLAYAEESNIKLYKFMNGIQFQILPKQYCLDNPECNIVIKDPVTPIDYIQEVVNLILQWVPIILALLSLFLTIMYGRQHAYNHGNYPTMVKKLKRRNMIRQNKVKKQLSPIKRSEKNGE